MLNGLPRIPAEPHLELVINDELRDELCLTRTGSQPPRVISREKMKTYKAEHIDERCQS